MQQMVVRLGNLMFLLHLIGLFQLVVRLVCIRYHLQVGQAGIILALLLV
jgi:hypothetical protein